MTHAHFCKAIPAGHLCIVVSGEIFDNFAIPSRSQEACLLGYVEITPAQGVPNLFHRTRNSLSDHVRRRKLANRPPNHGNKQLLHDFDLIRGKSLLQDIY